VNVTRDDKFENTAFYDSLRNKTTSDILTQLNFKYYTDDEFNNSVSILSKCVN